jgi:hypothetical protein
MKSFYSVWLALSGGVYRDDRFTYGTLAELQQSLDFDFWTDLRDGGRFVLEGEEISLQTYIAGRMKQQISLVPFITVLGPNGVAFTLPEKGPWYTLDKQNRRRLIAGTDVPLDDAFFASAQLYIDWGAVPLIPLQQPVLSPAEEAEHTDEPLTEAHRESFKYGYFNAESGADDDDARFRAAMDKALAIDPNWLTVNGGAVQKLVESMHRSGDYSAMPVLADALLEAGCENELLLSHCRLPAGAHARGSWLVERLRLC